MCAPHPLSHQTLLGYNPASDLAEAQDPLGNTTRLQTDGAGRTIQTTTPKGYDWLQTHNGKSQPRIETDPLGGKIERVYDQAGRLVSIWDQNGNPVERYGYDARGNLVSKTDATNKSVTYQYDSANRLTQTISRKGEVVSYAYGRNNQLPLRRQSGDWRGKGRADHHVAYRIEHRRSHCKIRINRQAHAVDRPVGECGPADQCSGDDAEQHGV